MNCFKCKKYFTDKKNIPLNLKCGHCFCDICIKNYFKINKFIICFKCKYEDKISIPDSLSKNFIALNLGCQQKEIMKKYKFCLIHKNEPLRFFCQNCKVTFCPSCIVDHNGHNFINKNFSNEKIISKINKLDNKLNIKLNEYKNNLELKEFELNKNNKVFLKYRKKFDNYYNEILEFIKNKYYISLDKIEEFNKYENSKLLDKEEEINKYLLKINEFQNNIIIYKNKIKDDNNFEDSDIVNKINDIKFNIDLIYNNYENKIKINHENIYKKILNLKQILDFKNIFKLKNKNFEPCLILLGEEKKIMIYNIFSNSWYIKNLPIDSIYLFSNKSSFTQYTENKIFITGGYLSNQCVNINLNNLKIKYFPNMLIYRNHHSSIFLNNKLYVLGGINETNNSILNNCEYLDITTNKWIEISPMNDKRLNFGIILFDDNTIIVAGGNNNSTSIKTIEKYNIKSNTWEIFNCKLENNFHKCHIFKLNCKEIIIITNSVWKSFKEINKLNLITEKIEIIKLESLSSCNIGILYNDNILFFGGNNFYSESYNLNTKESKQLFKYDEYIKSNLDNWNFCIMDYFLYDKDNLYNYQNSNKLPFKYNIEQYSDNNNTDNSPLSYNEYSHDDYLSQDNSFY